MGNLAYCGDAIAELCKISLETDVDDPLHAVITESSVAFVPLLPGSPLKVVGLKINEYILLT